MLPARARPFVLSVLAGVLAAMAPLDAHAQNGTQPDDARAGDSQNGTGTEEAPAAADAPSPASVDRLVNEGYLQRTEDVPPPLEPPPRLRSLWTVGLGLGLTFGGEEVFFFRYSDGTNEKVLPAGSGGFAFVGTTLTPYRAGRQSAGLELDLGVKGNTVSYENPDAQVTLLRYPLVLYARYGYDIGNDWSLVAGGGFQIELGVNAFGMGEFSDIDRDLDEAVGGIVQAGIIWEGSSLGGELFVRYTGIEYDGPDLPRGIDGSSIGVFYSVHLNLLRTPVARLSR